MKTFVMKNKKARGIVMAITLGAAPLLTSFSLNADSVEQLSEREHQEKKQIIAFLTELREYADAFLMATKTLFLLDDKGKGATKQFIQKEYKQLSSKISEILAKCAQHTQNLQEKTHRALMAKLYRLIQSFTKCQNQLKAPLSKLETPAYAQAMLNVKKNIESEFKTIIGHTNAIEKYVAADQMIKPVFDSLKKEVVTTLVYMQNNQQSLEDGVKYRSQKRK